MPRTTKNRRRAAGAMERADAFWLPLGVALLAILAAADAWSAQVPARPQAADACFEQITKPHGTEGRLSVVFAATTDAVRAVLLDFDRAAGHRAWFRRAEVLESEPGRILARWEMHGKLGINPKVTIEFRILDEASRSLIRFRIVDPGFGLAVFSGCYTLEALSLQPPRTRLTQTVLIDSGLPFVGASREDVAAGLQEDAALLREWLLERKTADLARLLRSPEP